MKLLKLYTMKNYIKFVAVCAIVVLGIVLDSNEGSMFNCGGGRSLKQINEASKTEETKASVNVALQLNQTTEQSLFQALVIGNYWHKNNGAYVGANFVGGVSNEFGVCNPVMSVNGGYDFGRFQVDAKIGNFKRSSITTAGVDGQYGNFVTVLGEGAGVSNAMQLSLIRNGFKCGFGHANGENFYGLADGNWYVYTELPVCQFVTVAGGLDFSDSTTGYIAGKVNVGNNNFTVTANKLGSCNQNLVVSYNRKNISLKDYILSLTASVWAKKQERGIHTVAGFSKGNNTLFAEAGLSKVGLNLTPKLGVGININF